MGRFVIAYVDACGNLLPPISKSTDHSVCIRTIGLDTLQMAVEHDVKRRIACFFVKSQHISRHACGPRKPSAPSPAPPASKKEGLLFGTMQLHSHHSHHPHNLSPIETYSGIRRPHPKQQLGVALSNCHTKHSATNPQRHGADRVVHYQFIGINQELPLKRRVFLSQFPPKT